MKKIFLSVALATAALAANAQLSFVDGTNMPVINGFNPGGGAPVAMGGKIDSTISTGSGGILTATYLGFEAIDTNTFSFNFGSGTLTNNLSPIGSSISGPVAAGNLNFTFRDVTTGTTVGNGGNGGAGSLFGQYAILGSFAGNLASGAFTPYTAGGLYTFVLGFNDGLPVDADFDDMVVGINLSPVPEPETYALFLAGLGAVGFIARRRRNIPSTPSA
jgi:hypothetical protein